MTQIIYDAGIFNLERFKFSKNGASKDFYRIAGKDSVTILPILDDGRVILERQYRPAIKQYLYEIPAGLIENGEMPQRAAIRELEEETGYKAKSLKLLFAAYPSPGVKTEFSTCYLATGLVKTKTNMDADEIITIRKVKLNDLVKMIEKNQIIDVKTIAAVLFYIKFSGRTKIRTKII